MNKINVKSFLLTVAGVGLVIAIIVCGMLGLIDKNKSLTEHLNSVITKETELTPQEKAFNSIVSKQDQLVDLAYSKKLADLIIQAREKGIDLTKLENYKYIFDNGYDVDVETLSHYNELNSSEYQCIFNELIMEVDLYNLMYFPNSYGEFINYDNSDGNINNMKYPYNISENEPFDTNIGYIIEVTRNRSQDNTITYKDLF